MRLRATALMALLALVLGAGTALAQVQTGEITGRVTDDSGAILPGVTVTLTSPVLIQPQTAASSENGTFRFPQIPIGTYTVKFELPGFKTVVREGIAVSIGFTATVNQQLGISTVQEMVTVSGESPIVDTKTTAERTTFDLQTLQNLPSARDPWVMLERTPGITMDRANIGGTQSGQQSGAPATTSGPSTAWTSPTCPRPGPRRSTTTSTCCRRCRSRPAARTRRSRPAASASTS
jgi:hypothetical protein